MKEKDTRQNWFRIHGDIRVNEDMTTKEFADKLDALGLEFVGNIKYSDISDEDYLEDKELAEMYGKDVIKAENGESKRIEIKSAKELMERIKRKK